MPVVHRTVLFFFDQRWSETEIICEQPLNDWQAVHKYDSHYSGHLEAKKPVALPFFVSPLAPGRFGKKKSKLPEQKKTSSGFAFFFFVLFSSKKLDLYSALFRDELQNYELNFPKNNFGLEKKRNSDYIKLISYF